MILSNRFSIFGAPLIVTSLCLSLLTGLPLQAQEPGLVETFDDPALSGWDISSQVDVARGKMRLDPLGAAFHAGTWGDLAMNARVHLFAPGQNGGQDEDALLVSYRFDQHSAYRIRVTARRLALQRVEGTDVTPLGDVRLASSLDGWFQLGATVAGKEHTLTLDGDPVLIIIDPDPLPAGGVGIEVTGQAVAEIDYIMVTAGSGAPPPTEEPPVAMTPAHEALPWVRTGGPSGGLGGDVFCSLADHNVWGLVDGWSGFHRSADGGLTWTPSNAGITTDRDVDGVPVSAATVDPHNPQTLWAGTQFTGGIFKSTDGGETWIEKTAGINPNLRPLTFRGFTVDPQTSDVVYVMGEISSPGWTPDQEERYGLEGDLTQGVVYRTVDGGEYWTQIWRGDNLAHQCWVDPRDSDVLYVATGFFDREAANTDVGAGRPGGVGILKSTDGGETWRVFDQGRGLRDLYVSSLAMHGNDPNLLLATAGQRSWSRRGSWSTTGIYRTKDGGEHWIRVANGELFSAVAWCPGDPDVAYAASDQAVHRSEDRGQTWKRFGRPNGTWGPSGIVAGSPIDIQCDPVDPDRVVINTSPGGAFLSENGGRRWMPVGQGYTGAQIHHLSVAPGRSLTVFAASPSGVFCSTNGGSKWAGLAYPPADLATQFHEIRALAVDPTDGHHLLAVPAGGPLLYSYDGGLRWCTGQTLGDVHLLLFAPSNSTVVYAAISPEACCDPDPAPCPEVGCRLVDMGLYVSSNGGVSWDRVEGTLNHPIAPITAMVIHPLDARTVYVSVPGTGLLHTSDGGRSWTPVGVGLPDLPVTALTIDPSDPNVLLAGIASNGRTPEKSGIYRSADGGFTWVQAGAGLNSTPWITSIVIDPTDGQVVYAADYHEGVYLSTDRGLSWQAINQGLIHQAVNVLALSDDGAVLYAGTMGAGVYRLGKQMQDKPADVAAPTPAIDTGRSASAMPAVREEIPTTTSPAPVCAGAAALPLAALLMGARRRRM